VLQNGIKSKRTTLCQTPSNKKYKIKQVSGPQSPKIHREEGVCNPKTKNKKTGQITEAETNERGDVECRRGVENRGLLITKVFGYLRKLQWHPLPL
jgi:hypothetical protein